MSEQSPEQTSGQSGSVDAGSVVPASPENERAASAHDPIAEIPHGSSAESSPKPGEAGDVGRMDAPGTDAPGAHAAKADAADAQPGRIMTMSTGDRAWDRKGAGTRTESGQNFDMPGNRRLSAMAAVVALAAVSGALGGVLATVGYQQMAGGDAANAGSRTLEASVARIDADIVALKAGVEHTARVGISQSNKTNDRLDKVEKAQAEPAAKLARLSEAVEKLRAPVAAPAAAAAAPAAAKETTGSISPPIAAAQAVAPKPEVARLPTVDGWALRDVANGSALIEGRQGIFEVYAGDPVPGLGRIDAIRRQDGRWVVVTSKGLIVAR